MSLDVDGFTNEIEGSEVIVKVDSNHKLLQLARNLPWEAMLALILPDLQRTERKCWWMGRPLRVRIHLGVYLLQQMFNLTDRTAEHQVRDNTAFRLFCGYGQIKKWHAPDHTKIETFRSRLSAETQRKLANLMSQEVLYSIATDKGYYSLSNEQLLIQAGVTDIYLPREVRPKFRDFMQNKPNELIIGQKPALTFQT